MSTKMKSTSRHKLPALSASLLTLMVAMPLVSTTASAEDSGSTKDRPSVSKKKPTGANSTINLVNLLVSQGVLKEEQAAALIKQAEDEAYVSREAARDATAKADEAAKAASAAASAASPPGSKRVSYVPEIVKRQLREDLRKEVMTQARAEGWASPGTYPEWASRIRFSGDFRGRWEGISYPGGGYNSIGQLYDFNSINTGSPYDLSSTNQIGAPNYNTRQDRNRTRLRARLGVDIDLYEGFTGGMRIATGSDSSPLSTNQTLGSSGGNFSKYAIWLDRAFIKYEPFKSPRLDPFGAPESIAITAGRFDNPFWSPTDLVWHKDLGFDGIALQYKEQVSPGFTPFLVAGAFPIFNTALDFSSTNDVQKFKSDDKYLFGGQLGLGFQVAENVKATFGAAVFDFSNVKGKLSSPCNVQAFTNCDTDALRPSFAQKGNTYMALRDVMTPAGYTGGAYPNPQYFGLASQYRPAVFSGRLEFAHFNPVSVVLDGEFVWNSAFDRTAISKTAINNRGPSANGDNLTSDPSSIGAYEGGNIGWMGRVTVGQTKLAQFGDWNAHIGYKYLESDAVMDAFADSDFGLGGTNLKGYFVGASFALSSNVWTSARWMSANAIAGVPYAVDIFQLDLNAKF
jgi:hypothetical protein